LTVKVKLILKEGIFHSFPYLKTSSQETHTHILKSSKMVNRIEQLLLFTQFWLVITKQRHFWM